MAIRQARREGKAAGGRALSMDAHGQQLAALQQQLAAHRQESAAQQQQIAAHMQESVAQQQQLAAQLGDILKAVSSPAFIGAPNSPLLPLPAPMQPVTSTGSSSPGQTTPMASAVSQRSSKGALVMHCLSIYPHTYTRRQAPPPADAALVM